MIVVNMLGKHFNRKDSADSGISGTMSRKTSTNSQISISSIMEEPGEETIKVHIYYTYISSVYSNFRLELIEPSLLERYLFFGLWSREKSGEARESRTWFKPS